MFIIFKITGLMTLTKLFFFISLVIFVASVSMPNLAVGRWSVTKNLPAPVDRYVKNKHP
jgi:hypothetical protein